MRLVEKLMRIQTALGATVICNTNRGKTRVGVRRKWLLVVIPDCVSPKHTLKYNSCLSMCTMKANFQTPVIP